MARIPSILILLLLCLLPGAALSGTPSSSPGPPVLLHPVTRYSPSGEWRLYVSPADRYGMTRAMTHMERLVEGQWQSVWQRDMPHTFWEFGVTNSGVVAGYAKRADEAGSGFAKTLWIGALDPGGEELWSKEWAVGFGPTPDSRAPNVTAMAIGHSPARLVVHMIVDVEGGGVGWHSFDLKTGAAAADFLSQSSTGPDWKSPWLTFHDLHQIPGSSLWVGLGESNDRAKGKRGIGITVMDSSGRFLWSKSWLDGHFRPGLPKPMYGMSLWVEQHALVLEPGTEGEFHVLNTRTSSYDRFVVAKESTGEVVVRAAGSKPADLEMPDVTPLPIVALERLSHLKLQHNQGDAFVPGPGSSMTFTSTGKVIASLGEDLPIHVFGPDAELLFLCEAREEELEILTVDGAFEGPDGELRLLLDNGTWRNPSPRYASFGPRGAPGDVRVFPGQRTLFADHRKVTWMHGPTWGEFTCTDAIGAKLGTIARTSKDRWFGGRPSWAIDRVGNFAVRDWSLDFLDLYDSEAKLTRSIALHGVPGDIAAMAGDWIAFQHRSRTAYLLRLSTGECMQVALPKDTPAKSRWTIGLDPSGQELWAISKDSLEFNRYALPK